MLSYHLRRWFHTPLFDGRLEINGEMAKELPYFRFTPQEWQNGDVSLLSLDAKGLFIDVACFYWVRDCNVTEAMLKQRFSHAQAGLILLFDSGIIKRDSDENGRVLISFLDEQFLALSEWRTKLSTAGSKGGKRSSKAKARLKAGSSYKDKDKDKDNKDNTLPVREAFWKDFDLAAIPENQRQKVKQEADKILDSCPRIFKLDTPLTAQQFYTACVDFSVPIVIDVLESMENYKDLLKKYSNANKTMVNWCKRRMEGK